MSCIYMCLLHYVETWRHPHTYAYTVTHLKLRHNILHCRQSRTQPRPRNKQLAQKISWSLDVCFWDIRADKQTHIQTRSLQHLTPLPGWSNYFVWFHIFIQVSHCLPQTFMSIRCAWNKGGYLIWVGPTSYDVCDLLSHTKSAVTASPRICRK